MQIYYKFLDYANFVSMTYQDVPAIHPIYFPKTLLLK